MNRRLTRVLLWCGAIGPPLFVIVALIEGATRPGYDAIRLPISLLALGDMGWIQTINFLVLGLLMIGFAIGLWIVERGLGKPGAVLIAVFGLGLVLVSFFPGDPGGGYPPGVRPTSTSTGTVHDLGTLLIFVALFAACLVFARAFAKEGERRWSRYSAATAAAVAIGFVLMFAAFSANNGLTRYGGLIQRATVVVGWTWITLLAIRALRIFRVRPAVT
jgi:Protein of unknown function (DUF998)